MAQKVRIRFSEAKDLKSLPVTGVWGGLAPTGEIVARMYIERRLDPESILMDVSGAEAKEEQRVNENDQDGNPLYVREIQTELIMRPETAYVVGQWLIEKARLAGVAADSEKH